MQLYAIVCADCHGSGNMTDPPYYLACRYCAGKGYHTIRRGQPPA